VKQTPDAIAFAAADDQRNLAVAAMLIENADHAIRVAEGNESVAQNLERKGIAIRRREIRGLHDWQPIPPQRLAHRRLRADAADQLVVLAGEHVRPPDFSFKYLPRKMSIARPIGSVNNNCSLSVGAVPSSGIVRGAAQAKQ
jgi:hypothetical protein